MQSITETSDWLAAELESTGRFVRMNPGGGESLPLVAFRYVFRTAWSVSARVSRPYLLRLKEKHHYDEVSR